MNLTASSQPTVTVSASASDSTPDTATAATPLPAATPAPRWVPTTPTGRKIRADSKLAQLDDTQRARLRFWLEDEHYSYREAAERVHKEFGLRVGKSAISIFWRRHILPDHFDDELDAALAFAALPPADFDTVSLRRAKALAWSELSSPFPRIDTVAQLLDVARRIEQQAITIKRLSLEERRVVVREKLAAHAQPRHSPTGVGGPPRRSRALAPADTSPTPQPPRLAPPPPLNPEPAITHARAEEMHQNPPLFPASSGLVPPAPAPLSPLAAEPLPSPPSHHPAAAPLPPSPTTDSSLRPAPPAHPASPEIPQNPPLYPPYSTIVPPSHPGKTPLPSPAPSAPSAPTPASSPAPKLSALPGFAARLPSHAYPQPLPIP